MQTNLLQAYLKEAEIQQGDFIADRFKVWPLNFIDGVEVFVPFDILDDFEGGEIELMFTQNCMQKNLFFATIIFDKLPNKNLRGNDASFVGT